MERLAARINVDITGYGFATEEEMESFIMRNYNGDKMSIDFLAGIVFTNPFARDDTFPKDIQVLNITGVRFPAMLTVLFTVQNPNERFAASFKHGSQSLVAGRDLDDGFPVPDLRAARSALPEPDRRRQPWILQGRLSDAAGRRESRADRVFIREKHE